MWTGMWTLTLNVFLRLLNPDNIASRTPLSMSSLSTLTLSENFPLFDLPKIVAPTSTVSLRSKPQMLTCTFALGTFNQTLPMSDALHFFRLPPCTACMSSSPNPSQPLTVLVRSLVTEPIARLIPLPTLPVAESCPRMYGRIWALSYVKPSAASTINDWEPTLKPKEALKSAEPLVRAGALTRTSSVAFNPNKTSFPDTPNPNPFL